MDELPQTTPTKDECNLAMLAHLLGIFTGFIGSLIIWLIKKDESAFVADQAKEALNFQITIAIAMFASWILAFILIGIFAIPMLIVVNFIFSILGAISASRCQAYRYPFALHLVK